jgi:hypothetical protein
LLIYTVKGNVVSALNYVIRDRAVKAYGGIGGIAEPFFTSTLDGGKCAASHPYSVSPWRDLPGTYCIGD